MGLLVLTGIGITAAVACAAPAEEQPQAGADENIGVTQSAFTPSTCASVDTQIRAAASKYNLPRWFLYAMAMRESSCSATAVNNHGGSDVGYGLMQLTHDWYTGVPLPFGYTVATASTGQNDTNWRSNMGIDNYCNQTNFPGAPCPWIDMKDITTLASGSGTGSYADAAANLDRFCSGYAVPAYHMFRALHSSESIDETLRRVAWHWRYGVFSDVNYRKSGVNYDPGNYLSGSAPYDYDSYVSAYQSSVETEDYGSGNHWNGNAAYPPYGGSSATWTASVTSVSPSGGSATVGCVNYAKATSATIAGNFQDTGGAASGYPQIEVWNGSMVASGHAGTITNFTTNSSTNYSYTWNVGSSGAGSYEIRLGILDSGSSMYSNGYFTNKGTIEVVKPGDGAKQDFECGNKYGWLSNGGILGTPTSAKTGGGYAGNYSLVVPVTGTAGGANHVYTQTGPLPAAGNTVTFHVYVPSGSSINVIQPYVKDTNFTFTGAWRDSGSGLVTGWNTVSLAVPSNAASMLEIGVELRTNASWSGNAYVDAVTW